MLFRYTYTRWVGSSVLVFGVCSEEGKGCILCWRNLHYMSILILVVNANVNANAWSGSEKLHLFSFYCVLADSDEFCFLKRGQPDKKIANKKGYRGKMHVAREDVLSITSWDQMHVCMFIKQPFQIMWWKAIWTPKYVRMAQEQQHRLFRQLCKMYVVKRVRDCRENWS